MAGIKIKIHPLFFLFGIYYAFIGKIFIFLIVTLTALLHELGHSFVAEKQGYKLNLITLMPYGAIVSGNIDGLKPKDEVLIAISGPLLNLLIAIFFVAIWWFFPLSYAFTEDVVSANMSLAVINCLPFFPLDGGRVILAILTEKTNKITALKVCKLLSVCFSVVLLVFFVVSIFYSLNFSMLFFSAFVFLGAINKKQENNYIKLYTNLNFQELLRGKPYRKIGISQEATIKKLISLIDGNYITEFVIFDNENNEKLINEKAVQEIIAKNDIYTKIKDVY